MLYILILLYLIILESWVCMLKKIRDNLIDIYIIMNILFIFISCYLRLIKVIEYIDFGNFIHVAAIINFIVIVFFIIIRKIKKDFFKFNIIDILLLLMLVFGFISTIFAYDVGLSINGVKPRYEGLFAIAYYLSLAYLSSYVKNKKLIINVILFTGMVQTIYAICQVNCLFGVIKYTHYAYDYEIWATGFIYNPNFFATYVLLCLLYSIGLFFDEKSIINKIMYCLLICLFMVGLLIANTTSCAVGFIISFIYLLFYSIKKKEFMKIICITVVLLLSSTFVIMANKTTLVGDLSRTGYEVSELYKGKNDEQFGTKRIGLWQKTLVIIPRYLLHGVGIDNFGKVLDGKAIKIGPYAYDKAHNEYLQILVTEGIFCLMTYLIFYFILVVKCIKNSFCGNSLYLIIPIIGYLVQAFFNISVIDVAPIFWIGIGFLIDRCKVHEC